MPFKQSPQKFNAAINTVTVGSGDKQIVLGGQNVLPFYTFDAPIENAPVVGVEISDLGIESYADGIKAYYEGASSIGEVAKKAQEMEGADFVCLHFDGADPNGEDKSVEECVAIAKEVADAIDVPLMVAGCKNAEKDAQVFEKVCAALEGKNIAVLSAKEENYKTVGASAGLAYNMTVGAETSCDINLAKQLNVLLTQLGVNAGSIVMNLGSAAAGYGFEYVSSTMDRVLMAALSQNDANLKMPVISPVSFETWTVKESVLPEAEAPEWGDKEFRGINMEVVTASACLASGSNAVILRHPQSVSTISKMIKALV